MPRLIPLALSLLMAIPVFAGDSAISAIIADPPQISLEGPNARMTVLIDGQHADGTCIDLTHQAHWKLAGPPIVELQPGGVILAKNDGETVVEVNARGKSLRIPVSVRGSQSLREFHFETDIVPLFGRFGCSGAGCHGKAEGQNGFKLSVFGYDPQADYASLRKEARGRRIFPEAPEQSLLLTKAAGLIPHGGGRKILVDSEAYTTIRDWILAGAPFGRSDAPRLLEIRIDPQERVLAFHTRQQLRVMAYYADGRKLDVTRYSRFQSNRSAVASVSEDGRIITQDIPGEAAIMAAYMDQVAVFRALVPRPGPPAQFDRPAANWIDPLVDAKLKKLNIAPSEPASDAEFLRRVYLDVIGTLPTAEEARAFLQDTHPNKRSQLVDQLLERPEYADYWALKWADLLQVERAALGHKRAYTYYRWIRESVAQNKPLDQLARELVTAEGPLDEVAPASFYLAVKRPGDRANAISQVFLGVRITCAECHHHPFDRWGQNDYAGMAAFFAPISVQNLGSIQVAKITGPFQVKHARTGEIIPPRPLGANILPESNNVSGDAREQLAAWLTAPENPYFARNLANRIWANFFGRGLVEPVDDVRSTNPASNPQLLDALARSLRENGYDVKQFIRTLTASRTYQTSSKPHPTNLKDDRNFSRALFRTMPAEVLSDAITQVLGVPEKFDGVEPGLRAIQLWDNRVRNYLLKTFGRPERMSPCECERITEPTLTGVLHLLNSPELTDRLRHDGGNAARWAEQIGDKNQLAEELTLTFYARFPTVEERQTIIRHLEKAGSQRRKAIEDLIWAMMNTREFIQNH